MALTVVGCVSAATVNSNNRSELLRRAAFDLDCPEAQLQTTSLDGNAEDEFVHSYGVTGCGKRGTYVRDRGRWLMNNGSVEQTAAGAQPSTPNAAPPAPAPTTPSR